MCDTGHFLSVSLNYSDRLQVGGVNDCGII